MPGFDPEIGKLAQRVLVNPRKIDSYTGVFASKVLTVKFSTFMYRQIKQFKHPCSIFMKLIPCTDYSCKGWKASTNRAHWCKDKGAKGNSGGNVQKSIAGKSGHENPNIYSYPVHLILHS